MKPDILKKTKIVCTIGPASQSPEVLEQLIKNGMNVARLNFSHGSHEEHLEKIKTIKRIRRKLNVPLGLMLDTKGPEIRIGKFEEKEYFLKPDDIFTLTTRNIVGNKDIVSVSYEGLPQDVEKGSIISVDDGLIQLEVIEIKDGTEIVCRVQNNGVISNNKGVNLPGRVTNLPSITPKDVDDIKFGIENGIDMIAASFVRKKEDIYDIRKVLEDHGGEDILIISKIESQEGVDNADEIIEASDGIMVARGDLGVEIRTELIPLVQKEIIRKCNKAAKPVITATQMLDSMQRNPRPTRAETTDVANAIIDGTDCVMLSGETAAGKYPVEAVKTMRDICITTELSDDFEENIYQTEIDRKITTTNAISKSTCTIASQLRAKAIITCTASGNTAKAVSKFRPRTNIIACTIDEKVARRLSVSWGVYPIIVDTAYETDELIERAIVGALKENYVQEGDLTVLTAGIPLGVSGTSNLIKVHVIGDIIANGTGVGNKSVSAKVVVGSTKEELEGKFEDGDIIVAKYTDKDINEFMERSSGVIAENGGLTSHTAVVAIHFGIPAILGVKNITNLLEDGDTITLDPLGGIIYKGEAKVL
ncbi:MULTISPECIES: pyruvate kinase [Anaerococcus]|uniref:Pyruvate kinase n=1 Tax=Anaerococcus obesiensis TaxID=1287640 RepID=A0A7T7ZUV0_9FIRM|nr:MULTISPECIES: pyruvate kinase [Anaerococcus]MBS6921351.1 pyruvate kinase [Anaerococcus vaginalis]MDU1030824.1 pyruvate kinase [Anaerococcus vaginalis]MDU5342218.1 pyruvate kinase [Anaerococcus vaginalis]MDU5372824.1 pyruvate kinase [Anaerococcus vaginalis]MDU5560295.1 pyruvate kinase [Anaerococcus vaginalis]